MLKQQNIAETLRFRTDAAPWAEVRRSKMQRHPSDYLKKPLRVPIVARPFSLHRSHGSSHAPFASVV